MTFRFRTLSTSCALAAAFSILLGTTFAADDLAPFGKDTKVPEWKLSPANKQPFTQPISCLGKEHAPSWHQAGIALRFGLPLFEMSQAAGKPAITLLSKNFDPGQTVLNFDLPDDNNGDVWRKQKADYIAFTCQSSEKVEMAMYLTMKGKSPGSGRGSYRTVFVVPGGAPQRIVLPFAQFGLKSPSRLTSMGLGIEAKTTGNITCSDFTVGNTQYGPDSWKTHRLAISIHGQWRFAVDPKDDGLTQGWQQEKFNDSSWQLLKSRSPWQDQGIVHNGAAWYRQKLVVPKEYAGTPLTLTLANIPFDDEVYVNGVKVGGLQGSYKYQNIWNRVYGVPASVIHYGKENTIAIRTWGAEESWLHRTNSGLVNGKGSYVAELNPYELLVRPAGGKEADEQHILNYDFSSAQQQQPFELILRFPAGILADGKGKLNYILQGQHRELLTAGTTPLTAGTKDKIRAVIPVDGKTAQTIYFRNAFKLTYVVMDSKATPVCSDTQEFDHLCFDQRNTKTLSPLTVTMHDTPYGKLKLVDEIDCATAVAKDDHPYMQGGFSYSQRAKPASLPVKVPVKTILGKQAREPEYGWCAYRVGRGKLKPHGTYLLRIEYPEDKRRFCPVEVQTGVNYMDVGWKNGISPDNPYDNAPLSGKWQWYDVIVVNGERTTGAGGSEDASSEYGFWVYFMNKQKPQRYFIEYDGGPAVARMRLYEIDPVKNAPVIRQPAGLPQRTLMVDWERQPQQDPRDMVKYCKLMGYNFISPIVLKWTTTLFTPPLSGYGNHDTDERGYLIRSRRKEGEKAQAALPGHPSMHERYLRATKEMGMGYIPRVEYGGSGDLPLEAHAIGADGLPAKPNRFHTWVSNLLHPAVWQDLKRTVDHIYKPYVKDNPQLKGMLWRIRCDRMQISYDRNSIEMFAKETGTKLPDLSSRDLAAWVSSGDVKQKYIDWWHEKRAELHLKLRDLLQSYRPDMRLLYYNWDNDKWWLGFHDLYSAAHHMSTVKNRAGVVPEVYKRNLLLRNRLKPQDYVDMIRTGEFGQHPGWGPDYGLHTELYKDAKGIELFAPADYVFLADNPTYLNYFKTSEGLAFSNAVSYDEAGSRYINPKYEGNMITPAGPANSMILELLAYFHGDAKTITYTVYTYGRGFADAHRRFAQAFLALPAIPGKIVQQAVTPADQDIRVRRYDSKQGVYVGVANKSYQGKKFTVALPGKWAAGTTVTDLVTGKKVKAQTTGNKLQFRVDSGPVELNSYVVQGGQ